MNPPEDENMLSNHNKWSADIDQILESIRHNCIILSEYHRTQYFLLQKKLKYFRIPVIVVSSFAAFFNFGLQPYLDQIAIATICSVMSLFAGLLGSLELYLQIQKKMENELMNSRDYYLNAIDIYKVIRLERKNRNGDGKTYLEERYNVFRKLIENSSLLIENSDLSDYLAPKNNAIIKRKNGDSIIDKFKLYCNLVESTNLSNTNLVDKLVPILLNPNKHTNDSVSFQDKLELYCTLHDKIPNNNREILDKLKPIILNNVQTINEDSLRERFLIYSDLMQYRDSLPKETLDKIKSVLLDEIKVNFDDSMHMDYINQMIQHNKQNNAPILDTLQKFTQLPRSSIFNFNQSGSLSNDKKLSGSDSKIDDIGDDIENLRSERT